MIWRYGNDRLISRFNHFLSYEWLFRLDNTIRKAHARWPRDCRNTCWGSLISQDTSGEREERWYSPNFLLCNSVQDPKPWDDAIHIESWSYPLQLILSRNTLINTSKGCVINAIGVLNPIKLANLISQVFNSAQISEEAGRS